MRSRERMQPGWGVWGRLKHSLVLELECDALTRLAPNDARSIAIGSEEEYQWIVAAMRAHPSHAGVPEHAC
eukprot:3851383-Rhodomonas_salina.3